MIRCIRQVRCGDKRSENNSDLGKEGIREW